MSDPMLTQLLVGHLHEKLFGWEVLEVLAYFAVANFIPFGLPIVIRFVVVVDMVIPHHHYCATAACVICRYWKFICFDFW